jgi:hypothetical protein
VFACNKHAKGRETYNISFWCITGGVNNRSEIKCGKLIITDWGFKHLGVEYIAIASLQNALESAIVGRLGKGEVTIWNGIWTST